MDGSRGAIAKALGWERSGHWISKEAYGTEVNRKENGRQIGQEEGIARDRRHVVICPFWSPWSMSICP